MPLSLLSWGFLSIYIVCSLLLMIYGLHCYLMLFLFLWRQKKARVQIQDQIAAYLAGRGDTDYPRVTIQLPVYNEAEVVVRLIESAAAVDYPKDRFEIQVVDDSTDETRALRIIGMVFTYLLCRRFGGNIRHLSARLYSFYYGVPNQSAG